MRNNDKSEGIIEEFKKIHSGIDNQYKILQYRPLLERSIKKACDLQRDQYFSSIELINILNNYPGTFRLQISTTVRGLFQSLNKWHHDISKNATKNEIAKIEDKLKDVLEKFFEKKIILEKLNIDDPTGPVTQPKRKSYTDDEIILCTFIARFGRNLINENKIKEIENCRSINSIKMKVQNIAAMLLDNDYEINKEISPLSGTPSGQPARKTNWDIVKKLALLDETSFLTTYSKTFERIGDNV